MNIRQLFWLLLIRNLNDDINSNQILLPKSKFLVIGGAGSIGQAVHWI
jgi:NADPH:quinone reductase-like Zn-dependent oxidoreductase